MDNIEIKRVGNKRNMESLLQQSGIDNNSFNYEAQQIRQAYTKTMRDLNQKIKDQQRTIQKLQLQLNQKNEILCDQLDIIKEKQFKLNQISAQNSSLKQTGNLIKKRMQQAEYKLQKIENNRSAVPFIEENMEQEKKYDETVDIKNIKKQVYKQITDILSMKISKFVKELKSFTMTIQLQQFIQCFLEEIIYINSSSKRKQVFENNESKNRKIGKISERRSNAVEKVSDLEEWKRMEKSLQKLKNASNLSPRTNNRVIDNKQIKKNNTSTPVQSSFGAKPSINYI